MGWWLFAVTSRERLHGSEAQTEDNTSAADESTVLCQASPSSVAFLALSFKTQRQGRAPKLARARTLPKSQIFVPAKLQSLSRDAYHDFEHLASMSYRTTVTDRQALYWIFLCLTWLSTTNGWVQKGVHPRGITKSTVSPTRLMAFDTSSVTDSAMSSIKETLDSFITSTDRGRSASIAQMEELEEWFKKLESLCPSEPARSPLVEGSWLVEYTTAPPPSNGQLGPFRGIAQQVVNLSSGSYQNILRVPPNDWLTATLDATWEDWDGEYLADDREEQKQPQQQRQQQDKSDAMPGDPGATCWKVSFETLSIACFGARLFRQEFPQDIARVWRTTYVDETTRLVRAGRTGRQDDEMLFYMTRIP